MKTLLFLLPFLFSNILSLGQIEGTNNPPVEEHNFTSGPGQDSVYLSVEIAPEFPGGSDSMMQFIFREIQYPPDARYFGMEGLVVVNFIVDRDGQIYNAKMVKSMEKDLKVEEVYFTLSEELQTEKEIQDRIRQAAIDMDDEVLRIMSLMPNWKPGTHKGKPVKVRMNLPVRYSLR